MQRQSYFLLVSVLVVLLSASVLDAQDGGAIFTERCASCHDGGIDRAPDRSVLRDMSAERVLAAMETGPMISMASTRTAADRRAIAEFITGKKLSNGPSDAPPPQAYCPKGPAPDFSKAVWEGWGQNGANTRYQDPARASLPAAQVPRLKVKWAFAFPGEQTSNGAITLAGGRLFVGSPGGKVYALSASTGCVYWYFQAAGAVRNAVRIERIGSTYAAIFGDNSATAYALDATTGAVIWKTKVEDHALARLSGSIAVYQGRLYVQSGKDGKTDWYRNLIKTPAVSMRIGELAMTGVAVPIEDLTEITRVHELFRQKYLRARMAEWIGSDTGRGKVVQLGELTQLP